MMHRGFTLMEVSVSVVLIGLMAGLTLPRFTGWRDRIAAESAASSTVALLSTARHAALRRAVVTAVSFDTANATVLVHAGVDTIARRALGEVHGVRLATTRDSIAYGPAGLGYGAANTRIIVARGAAAETVTVSRLGRARR
jgi:prepilin-type N-terminal cleavage/methylation domain-containing protein